MLKKYLVLLSLFFIFGSVAGAQTTVQPATATAQTTNAADILAQLPDSEAVLFIDAKRLFADTLPLVAAKNPAQTAEINRQI